MTKYLLAFLALAAGLQAQNLNLKPGSVIYFKDADSSHAVGLKGPNVVTATVEFTLPTTDGTAGQALLTDGSGAWYWGAGGSGGTLADGDYGDVTVSGGGTVISIDDGVQIDGFSTDDEAFGSGWNGVLEVPTKNSLYDKIITLADPNTSVAWFDNIRQTFNPGALQPGFNVGSYSGDPSAPINGDLWYDSAANELNAWINGAVVALGAGGGGSSALTATYVGYGDGSNVLTGEAAFHYNATTNVLTVPVISTPDITATSAATREFYIQDSADDDYLKIDVGADLTSARTLTITPPDANTTLTVPASLTVAGSNYLNAWADGIKQTFNPSSTTAGVNVGSVAGDPSTPANGDIWYDSTANELTARINGATVALGAGGGSGNVTKVGTPVNNQVGVWTGDGTLEGDAAFTFDTSTDTLSVTTIDATTLTVDTLNTTALNAGAISFDDSDASHQTTLNFGSNLTSDRSLDINTGDSDRTIILSGDPTLGDWFDQSVKAAASPTFANVTVGAEAYDATGWNGDNTAPTKNDVRDKIESMGSGSGLGYVLMTQFPSASNWADSSVQMIGTHTTGGLTYSAANFNLTKLYVPKAGTLKGIHVKTVYTSASGTETVTAVARINDTTDVGSVTFTMDSSDGFTEATDTTVSTAVSVGDYISLKITCPAWAGATNPTSCRAIATFYIE